ncbi:MAG: hypothetical protein PVI86_06585 [Phycisphaerae bacterium]
MRSLVVIRWTYVAAAAWLSYAAPASAQLVEQSFALRPGWNAVYLEVDPDPDDVGAVLGGQPITAVWTRTGQSAQASAVVGGPSTKDSDELVTTDAGWRVWFPSDRPEHVVSSLRTLRGGRVYLIEASAETTLTVSGVPFPGTTRWQKGHNLVGFHVARGGDLASTFSAYLDASPAFDGRTIYEITPDGSFSAVTDPDQTRITRGRGYWVEAAENATYDGPIKIDRASLRGIELAPGTTEHGIAIQNLRSTGGDAHLAYVPLPETPASPLKYDATTIEGADGQTVWRALDTVTVPLDAAGQAHASKVVRLALDQTTLADGDLVGDDDRYHRALIRVWNDTGYERYLSVLLRGGDPVGLWVGEVTVNGVESLTAPAAGTQTASPFMFRLILHRSSTGAYTLLRDVVLITNDQGGPPVLVTSECQELLDGQDVAPRISSANFSFDGAVALTGDFATQLQATLLLDPAHPLDPYRHGFHPEHANGLVGGVTRAITLTFDGDGGGDPGWGITRLGGSYVEYISGLHRETIDVSGTFEIRKVSDIGSLCGE